MMTHTQMMAIFSGEDQRISARLLRGGLTVGEKVYASVTGVRNVMFDWGWRKPRILPRAVISVGNLTTGGTGKTPMVIDLTQRLQRMGVRPGVLLRGYGKRAESGREVALRDGDEAVVLREALGKEVPVRVGASRYETGMQLLREQPDLDVLVLDDGFQHRQVHRDLDVVLLDAENPLGFERMLPRGLLRESVWGLRRADAVILTRAEVDKPSWGKEWELLQRMVMGLSGRLPIAVTTHVWTALRDEQEQVMSVKSLAKLRVVGACGIAQPWAFAKMLQEQAGSVVKVHEFADHHPFADGMKIVREILEPAQQAGAQACVVTEKDWVKWRERLQGVRLPMPVYRPMLGLRYHSGAERLERMMAAALGREETGQPV